MQTQECVQHIFLMQVDDCIHKPMQDLARAFSYIETKVQQIVQSVLTAIEWSKTVLIHLSLLCVSNHVLAGVCKITGYEVLAHGTSWNSFLSILQNGADPSRGGETSEASPGGGYSGLERIKGKFFVTKDSETSRFSSNAIPLFHSALAYVKEYKKCTQLDNKTLVPLGTMIASVIAALFTPRIRFIYTLDEIHGTENEAIFEDDPDYDGRAYRTSLVLPGSRIGWVGLAGHMNLEHVRAHLQNNPERVAQGVVQVALGVLLTATGLGILL